MRSTPIVIVLAALSTSCGRGENKPMTAAAAEPAREQMLQRGEYLVTMSGCDDCHTPGGLYGAPDRSRRLSGSELGWKGPWGISYPRNLTPDATVGIGRWTEDDIVRAIRTGKRPDGSMLLPPMPWPNYAKMTDADAKAIAVFLKSIPAVAHAVPATKPPDAVAEGAFLALPPPPHWDVPKGVGGGPPH